jgi:hypothetical protein
MTTTTTGKKGSTTKNNTKEFIKELESRGIDVGSMMLQAFNPGGEMGRLKLGMIITFIAVIAVNILVLVIGTTSVSSLINDMHQTYVEKTEQIIKTKTDIELTNAWERLPINQRKERLRNQWYEIVRFYTNTVPEEQKMDEKLILSSFNVLWDCTQKLPHVNFFLPVAYMKVKTNFNPVYDVNYQRGIIGFYPKMAERIANLPLIRTDDVFKVAYKGIPTLNNPKEAIKLLVARIDDLMITFNNREDWVLLSLFLDEYQVISKYWDGGEGKIPDEFYTDSNLSNSLMYYHHFKSWQIPAE